MTDITAKIIADSISPSGNRLTTIQMRYPRFIHAENKTHRLLTEHGVYDEDDEILIPSGLMYDPALSRNARSSRAVPVETMIAEVMENPVIPIHWGAAQKGMQAYNENSAEVDVGPLLGFKHSFTVENEKAWLLGRDAMVKLAESFHRAGYAKQVINRLLEPWLHIDTLVSATEWSNFLGLRDHHMAEPHIRKLAQEVRAQMAASEPDPLTSGEWHLPYITAGDKLAIGEAVIENPEWDWGEQCNDVAIKLSVARCARISYTPFDGNSSIEKELERYDLLVGSAPLHASPAEHQATPDARWVRIDETVGGTKLGDWKRPEEHGNFVGWRQHRKMLDGEHITEVA